MAYVSQELKAELAPAVKAVLKKYGVKGTLSVRHYSTLVLNVKSGSIDFIGNFNETVALRPGGFRDGKPVNRDDYLQVNVYWAHEHFSGEAKDFLREVLAAMNDGNWDQSDIQSDYFNVGWYVDVNIGKWNKPYEFIE